MNQPLVQKAKEVPSKRRALVVVMVEAAVDTVAEAVVVEVAVEAVAVITVIVVPAAETAVAVDTIGINPTTLQTFKSNASWTFFMP
jgi:hypothetical protein